jgi:hypothetical protein
MDTALLPYIDCAADSSLLFRNEFDRTPFAFTHTLQDSPYFTMPAIRDLVARLAPRPGRWYIEHGDTTPEVGWSGGEPGAQLMETLDGIADNRSLIILKRVQLEPEYNEILGQLQDELSEMLGFDLMTRYRDGLMTVLVASPGRVTPYHLDGEANLLMQISGSKSVYIFDGNNREVLPWQELEGFWSGDIKAPRYREQLQDGAWEFVIEPGMGVTNPVIFPHWVRNGDRVSISLSVNFKRITDDLADAHKVNRKLRSLGLHPAEPGSHKTVDHLKAMAYRTAWRAKRYLNSK